MYPSVKVHYENGVLILDEPMPVQGNVKGIFVILDDNNEEEYSTIGKDYLANESSLAKEWLSEEDGRWDILLK